MSTRRSFLSNSSTALFAGLATPLLSQSQNSKIKVAQIGTEHAHAEGKLSTIQSLSEVFELLGVVCESNSQRILAEKNKPYDSVKWLSEEEVLQNPEIKAVVIETNVSQLVPTALRCVKAGKHIHLDKPAGENLEEFQKVISIARQNNLQLQMGYMYRYNPAFEFCYHAVKEGWLGNIFAIHAVMSKHSEEDKRLLIAKYSGGTMFELGCHVIDSIVYLLGKPQSVTAFHKQSTLSKDSLKDNQLAVLEYPSAIATVRASLIEPYGFEQRQFVVNGTEGTIEIQPLEPPFVKISSNIHPQYQNDSYEVKLSVSKGRYYEQLLDFANTIQGIKKSDFSYQHDFDTHSTILQACS